MLPTRVNLLLLNTNKKCLVRESSIQQHSAAVLPPALQQADACPRGSYGFSTSCKHLEKPTQGHLLCNTGLLHLRFPIQGGEGTSGVSSYRPWEPAATPGPTTHLSLKTKQLISSKLRLTYNRDLNQFVQKPSTGPKLCSELGFSPRASQALSRWHIAEV